MALEKGDYTFVCVTCKGSGQEEVGPPGEPDHPDHDWVTCDTCEGSGEMVVPADEAGEMIDYGFKLLRIELASD